jgi:hypothetical protein
MHTSVHCFAQDGSLRFRSMSLKRKTPVPPSPLSRAIERGYARYLKLALALPLTAVSTSYGTPAVKVHGKLLSAGARKRRVRWPFAATFSTARCYSRPSLTFFS